MTQELVVLLVIAGWVVGVSLGILVQYLVLRYAIQHALRAHYWYKFDLKYGPEPKD
ncbi:hypothetical protein [Ruicaihuangia caeni]|uniref:hypothetical protein n=1 Tax=Ruicaihuangia caeni TaxID=3042517 RepID=UPI0033906011